LTFIYYIICHQNKYIGIYSRYKLDKIPTYIWILTYTDDIIILGSDSQEVKKGTKNELKTKYILISRR